LIENEKFYLLEIERNIYYVALALLST